jgi:hypothetical protein
VSLSLGTDSSSIHDTLWMRIIRKARVVVESHKTFQQVMLIYTVHAEYIQDSSQAPMHIINNTQVQQAFSVFNPEHNPDFPIHTVSWLDSLCYYRVGTRWSWHPIHSHPRGAPIVDLGIIIFQPPRTPRVLRTSSVRALLRRLLSTQAIDQEFRETLEKACFRTDVIRLDCDVGPLLSFVLTADRGTGPPILQTHPRIPHSLEIRPHTDLQVCPSSGLQSCSRLRA